MGEQSQERCCPTCRKKSTRQKARAQQEIVAGQKLADSALKEMIQIADKEYKGNIYPGALCY